MSTIHVDLGPKSYDIEIGAGILDGVGAKVKALLPKAKMIAIISDTNVAPLYAKRLLDSLKAAGLTGKVITIEAGEQSKNMTVLSNVLEAMAMVGMTRSDAVLTLGGGVVGDLGGFAAASFMRGVPFIQIPTSFLAQIDSSVGGKVAVDLKAGKNLAGAFYQPKAVFIDTEMLKTLPVHFLHDGLAEAIKYGCIADEKLFELIESCEHDEALLANIGTIIHICCAIKARIVEEDEFDTGLRMILNFGHTLGHAVEQHYGYSAYTHGEGVAIGMYQLTARTEELGISPKGFAERLRELLERFNLPVEVDCPKEQLLATMSHDKKKNGNSINIIIMREIGKAEPLKLEWQEVPKYLG